MDVRAGLLLASFAMACSPLPSTNPDAGPVLPGRCGQGAAKGPTLLATATGGNHLAVDAEHIYWNTFGVLRLDKDGGGQVVLAPQPPPSANVRREGGGIALDDANVYFAPTPEGKLWMFPKAAPDQLTYIGGPQGVVTSSGQLAVDADAVYETADSVWRIRKDEAGLLDHPLYAANGENERTQFVALDDTYAYWTTLMDVRRAPKAGHGTVEVLGDTSGHGGLALDGDDVYWLVPATNAIMKARKDGSGRTVVHVGDLSQVWPRALALDHDRVYWAAGEQGGFFSVRKDGSDPQTIGERRFLSRGIAVDDEAVYFTRDSGQEVQLWRWCK